MATTCPLCQGYHPDSDPAEAPFWCWAVKVSPDPPFLIAAISQRPAAGDIPTEVDADQCGDCGSYNADDPENPTDYTVVTNDRGQPTHCVCQGCGAIYRVTIECSESVIW